MAIIIEETLEMADWLKTPSELEVSTGKPDAKKQLEDAGLTDTPLYRKLKADPDFEKKLRALPDEPRP